MPTPSIAAADAQNGLHKAHIRIFRGFNSPVGGQDRFRWLEGERNRLCALAVQRIALVTGHLMDPTGSSVPGTLAA